MTKQTKLQTRLESLEEEFRNLLLKELKLISDGAISIYLEGKNKAYLTSRSKKSAAVDRMEYLEKEIYTLQEKVGVSSPASPIMILEEFLKEEEKAAIMLIASRDEKKRIARALLNKYGSP